MENYDDVPAFPVRKRVRPSKKEVAPKKKRVEIRKVEDFMQDEALGINRSFDIFVRNIYSQNVSKK